jgi:hypothetical protein
MRAASVLEEIGSSHEGPECGQADHRSTGLDVPHPVGLLMWRWSSSCHTDERRVLQMEGPSRAGLEGMVCEQTGRGVRREGLQQQTCTFSWQGEAREGYREGAPSVCVCVRVRV